MPSKGYSILSDISGYTELLANTSRKVFWKAGYERIPSLLQAENETISPG